MANNPLNGLAQRPTNPKTVRSDKPSQRPNRRDLRGVHALYPILGTTFDAPIRTLLGQMSCEVRIALARDCTSASEEFDRLRKQMQARIGYLGESEYQGLSARVQAA